MGAHFNSVSISIVNAESKTSLDWSYNATDAGLYDMYNTACLCGKEMCGFCTQVTELIDAKNGTFKNLLASEDARRFCFLLTSLRVIIQVTSSLGPRRILELMRKFCSADII
jgi:hypothetical protein